jgi:hypothetical protein
VALSLCGPHGCGKTSTASEVVKLSPGMVMVPSRGSSIFKALNLPLDRPLSFDERILVQWAILDAHVEDVTKAGCFAISDRTTIDMAAYTLGEWGANCTGEQGDKLLRYVDRCFTVANRLYSSIVFINPGIPYAVDPKRPPKNEAAVELFTYLAKSLLRNPRLNMPIFEISRSVTDLTERVNFVCNVWNSVYAHSYEQSQLATNH